MSKFRICKTLNNTRILLLALFVVLLFSSCSPNSLTLWRVGIENDKDSRLLSAVIDPLGSYIYYRTIYKGYKGSGDYYYSSNFSTSYKRLTSEGIIVSQGLWEVQVVFSNEEKTSYTESEAEPLIHATSGDIFINLNTTTITVELESGDGYAEITSYQLTGNVPSSPSVEVQLFKYNGSTFDSITDTAYSGFINGTLNTNNVFTNTKTSLPAGIYYVVLTVKSSSSVKFVDTIAFVVRKGLTTSISGSCNKYGESSGSIYIDPVENEKPSTSTDGIVKIDPPSMDTITNKSTGTVVPEITNGMIYLVKGNNDNETVLGHSTSEIATNEYKNSRLNVPERTKFAMNLNGTDVYLSKIQSNGRPSENENALVAELNNQSFMTIFNNNNGTGKNATFAILLNVADNKSKAYNRRLQSNIQVDNSTLNVVGLGASDAISNGNVTFVGPTKVHTNIDPGEYRQGAINLKGTGGTINLDGSVSVEGLFGITSWHVNSDSSTTKNSSISGIQNTSITIKNGARINTSSDSNCESAPDNGGAHGIYLYRNENDKSTGSTSITLQDSSITTTSAGGVTSAGIRIENFAGNVTIHITNSSIAATNGYGIYIDGFHKSGSIAINIENNAIVSSSKTMEAGCGIYIKDFDGSITINVLGNSEVKSEGNYGIHIDNCNVGSINITKSSESKISGKNSPVFINGVPKTFSTDGKISIPANN